MHSLASSSLSRNLRQLMPIVRRIEIKNWSLGNDAIRVHVGMTLVVMQLDVFKIASFLHTGLLVQIFEIVPEIWILKNVAQVALEVDVINRVEAE